MSYVLHESEGAGPLPHILFLITSQFGLNMAAILNSKMVDIFETSIVFLSGLVFENIVNISALDKIPQRVPD